MSYINRLFYRTATQEYGLAMHHVTAILPGAFYELEEGQDPPGFVSYERTPFPDPAWYQVVSEAPPVDGLQQWQLLPSDTDLEVLKARQLDRLAARRKVAVQDFTFQNMSIKLDSDTENAINKAITAMARQASGMLLKWEVSRGVIVEFDLPTLEAIGDAAFLHVQACFANVAMITQAINSAVDLEALVAIDLDAGWPA